MASRKDYLMELMMQSDKHLRPDSKMHDAFIWMHKLLRSFFLYLEESEDTLMDLPTAEQQLYTNLGTVDAHISSLKSCLENTLFDTEKIKTNLNMVEHCLFNIETEMRKCFAQTEERSGCY